MKNKSYKLSKNRGIDDYPRGDKWRKRLYAKLLRRSMKNQINNEVNFGQEKRD